MQSTPVFYQEIVPLDRRQHGALFFAPGVDYRYAMGSNAIFLATVEFGRTCHEYPIVFGDDGQTAFPLVVLGLRDGENLFVTAEGKWNASYIPAYVRRYPFILSTQPDSDVLTVCIDQSSPNFNSEQRGMALFEGGMESDFLRKTLDFLKDFQAQYVLSIRFAARLKALGILEPMQANVEINTGARLRMGGFFAVNRQRLADLPAEQLAELVRDGGVELIYLHLNSLDNFSHLMGRLPVSQAESLAATPTVGSA
ncbi:conserved hypothetical protein [Gammaproteobacteria bacterium]